MSTLAQIKQNITEIEAMRTLAQIYTETSASKLQKIRSGIIRNRLFFEELAQIYHVVKVSALKANIKLAPKTKKSASLLITSNSHFYGSLEMKLIRFFLLENAKVNPSRNQILADLYVIGKTGQGYLKSLNYSRSFTAVNIEKDLPDEKEFYTLSKYLADYQQIFVYYSKLKSIAIQEPAVIDITESAQMAGEVEEKNIIRYIFEPEIHLISEFFETQMVSLLLQLTFFESELARTGSRLIAMDQAKEKAETSLLEEKKILAMAKRSQANAKLLEAVGALLKSKEM